MNSILKNQLIVITNVSPIWQKLIDYQNSFEHNLAKSAYFQNKGESNLAKSAKLKTIMSSIWQKSVDFQKKSKVQFSRNKLLINTIVSTIWQNNCEIFFA